MRLFWARSLTGAVLCDLAYAKCSLLYHFWSQLPEPDFPARWRMALLALAHRSTQLQAVAHLRGKLLGFLGLLILFSPVLDLYLCHTYQLSFYNRFVGGIRGAYRHRLRLASSMEAFTSEPVDAINTNLLAIL